jgi:hypothetical protein
MVVGGGELLIRYTEKCEMVPDLLEVCGDKSGTIF